MINVNTNECVASGNIAIVLEDFKARNYPNDLRIVDEDNAIIVSGAGISGRRHEDTIKRVEDLIEDLIKELCKRCPKCGRLLPKEAFNKRKASPDGLQYNCKYCHKEWDKNKAERKKEEEQQMHPMDSVTKKSTPLHKVYSNPDLAKFTPRELMAELKARGFRWDWMLEPQKKIMFDKI